MPGINNLDYEKTQGQWVTRSFLEIMAGGADRAMVHCIRDTEPSNAGNWDGLTGLMKRTANGGFLPKEAWYYTHNMKEVLKNLHFVEEVPPSYVDPTTSEIVQCSGAEFYGAGSTSTPCHRVSKFSDGNQVVWAVWLPSESDFSSLVDFPLSPQGC